MNKWIVIGLLLVSALGAEAQPPLSKRDQKRLEEFEEKLEAERKYEETIRQADSAFKEDRYVDARMLYSEAIEYDEEKQAWLTAKVNDLDILLARNIARSVDSVTTLSRRERGRIELEDQPDLAIREMNVELEPVTTAEDTAEVPGEEMVVEDEPPAISTPAEKASQPKPVSKTEASPESEKKKPAAAALFKDFPQGITEEVFTSHNHEVVRIVVKDGMDIIVYKKVTHRWGGEFYFKDDVSISKRIWSQEVGQYRKKFGSQTDE